MRHVRELAEQLAEDGDRPNEQLRLAVRDPRTLAMNVGAFVLLIGILVLMVWKP